MTKYTQIGNMATFRTALNNKAAKIVFWGDSITEGIGQVAYEDSWAGLLEVDIRRRNPEIAWSFENLSIGGRGIGEANSDSYIGSAYPESVTVNFFRPSGIWNKIPNYTLWPCGSTIGKTWYNHVRDASPDLLIIALGMNDTSGDANAWAANLKALYNWRIKTWAKVPSVAIVTPMLPTRNDPTYATYNPRIQANADAMRGVCEELNLTLIDANRLYRILRDGADVVRTQTRYNLNFADFASWPTISGDRPTTDGTTLSFATPGIVLRDLDDMNVSLSADVSVQSANTYFGIWYRQNPADANKAYVAQIANGNSLILYYNSVPIASATIPQIGNGTRLHVVAEGARHKVYVGGTKYIDVFDYQRMYGGRHGLSAGAGVSMTNYQAKSGYPRPVEGVTLSDDTLLGAVYDYDTNPNSLGGNLINHPTIIGHYRCYLEACQGLIDFIEKNTKTR